MYARLVSGSIPSEKLDEAVQLWRDTVLPSVQQQKGFKRSALPAQIAMSTSPSGLAHLLRSLTWQVQSWPLSKRLDARSI